MHLAPGQEIDRYTVLDQLGAGGMAVVYRVRHNTLGTEHALKVLSLNVPSIRERLIQEGRVQAQLEHPHVVAVTDVLDVQGSPGLLMQLVRGPSLDIWLQDHRPTLPEALRIFDGILDALRQAHRLDIVHRDLKPGNIMVATQRDLPWPKVTDFGLAKLLADESTPTRTCTGLPMGTPAYMSPEQITDAKSVDARTDIFALGCILYELVCGSMAFRGANTLEVFNAVAGGHYTPPRQLAPDLPDPVVAAIQGCLQSQRELRIPSCEVLASVLEGQPFRAHPSDAPTLAPPLPDASPPSSLPASSPAAPTFTPLDSLDGNLVVSTETSVPLSAPTSSEAPRRRWWPLALVAAAMLVAVLGALITAASGAYWLSRDHGDPPLPAGPREVAEGADPSPAPGETTPPREPVTDPIPPVHGDPRPQPELAAGTPEPEPEEDPVPAPPATGLVRVEGDAVSVELIDGAGRRHLPGSLPPGRYDLEADFADGTTIRQPGQITVRAGVSTTLRCSQLAQTCR